MREFCVRLGTLITTAPKMVFFAVMMIFGLRPAEGAAIKPKDIKWREAYCTVRVVAQAIKGKIVDRTKNPHSIRTVVIPYWGMVMLRECCDQIGDNYPQDDVPMNDAECCSETIKNLLVNCGANRMHLSKQALNELDADDMDEDDRKCPETAEKKIVCYVLRRNFASMCRNVMGLSLAETDALMGHVQKGNHGGKENSYARPDLSIPEKQLEIAAKMERYVFDPNFSLHPAHNPITLSPGDRIEMMEYPEYVIMGRANGVLKVDLNLIAAECGESITIVIESDSEAKLRSTFSVDSLKKNWESMDRNVIGDSDRWGRIEWER